MGADGSLRSLSLDGSDGVYDIEVRHGCLARIARKHGRNSPRGLALIWPFHAQGSGPFLAGLFGSARVSVIRKSLQSLDYWLCAA